MCAAVPDVSGGCSFSQNSYDTYLCEKHCRILACLFFSKPCLILETTWVGKGSLHLFYAERGKNDNENS